jgi:group I intron endonuclease
MNLIVYLITNKANGHYYVGQTARPLEVRWKEHIAQARQKRDYRLHRAIEKHGPGGFHVEVLAEAETEDRANLLESLWILSLRAYDKDVGYNLSYSGSVRRLTEESRAKLRAKLKGKPAWNKGISPSPETLQKMRQRKHSVITAEGREKIRQSKLGPRNPNYGKVGAACRRYRQDVPLEKIKALLDEGKNQREIATFLQCSTSLICDRVKKLRESNV